MAKMNEIEQKFYDAFKFLEDNPEYEHLNIACDLEPQVKFGKFIIDFLYSHCAIEIDGHEYHKTKEQRMKDYRRERYLIKHGFWVIRFTGSEVYHDPIRCVLEMLEIDSEIEYQDYVSFNRAYEQGVKRGSINSQRRCGDGKSAEH